MPSPAEKQAVSAARQALVMYLSFMSAVGIIASWGTELLFGLVGLCFGFGAIFSAWLTVTADGRRGKSIGYSLKRLALFGGITLGVSYAIFRLLGIILLG